MMTSERDLWQKECESRNQACCDAINLLWRDMILARRPKYGDWEYAGQAYRHLLAEFTDVRDALSQCLSAMDMQEKREREEFHIPGETALCIWRDAQAAGRKALEPAAVPAQPEDEARTA